MNNSLPEDSPGAMGMPRSITSSPVPPSVQSTAWMSCRRMIYIKSSPPSGHWPVPESFWPDPSMQTLVRILLQNSTQLTLASLGISKTVQISHFCTFILSFKLTPFCVRQYIFSAFWLVNRKTGVCSVETCIAFGKCQWEFVTIISESENVVSKILLNVL